MTNYFILFSLVLASVYAETPNASHTAPTTSNRATVSPSDFIKKKEAEHKSLEEELKIKESALDFWQSELDKANLTSNTSQLVRGASIVSIPASYYLGGKILKIQPSANKVKNFLSLGRLKKFIENHPKLAAGTFWTLTIGSAATVTADNTYYLWAVAPEKIKELLAEVAEAKKEVAAAREKMDRSHSNTNVRKPDNSLKTEDAPDKLDGN